MEFDIRTQTYREVEVPDLEPIPEPEIPEQQEIQTPEERLAALEEQLAAAKILLGLES